MVAILFREMDGARTVAIGMGPNDAWKIMGMLEEKSLRQRAGEQFEPALSFFFFLQQLMKKVEASIDQVVITGYENGMWKATLSLAGSHGSQEIVCRASDGVALGLATEANIFATEEALEYEPA